MGRSVSGSATIRLLAASGMPVYEPMRAGSCSTMAEHTTDLTDPAAKASPPWQDAEAVIRKLDSLGDDNPRDHIAADKILVCFLKAKGHGDVAAAYDRAADRVGFWYE